MRPPPTICRPAPELAHSESPVPTSHEGIAGRQWCPKCGEDKPERAFSRNASRKTGRACHCKDCQNNYHKLWYMENRTKKLAENKIWSLANKDQHLSLGRRWHLNKRYSLSGQKFLTLMDKQRGRCAICGKAETRLVKGTLANLCVDHDHATGKVRGLLCSRCNSVLGLAGDSGLVLRKAIAYLEVVR